LGLSAPGWEQFCPSRDLFAPDREHKSANPQACLRRPSPPCRSDFSPTLRLGQAACRTEVRIWTPPVLPARMLDNKGIDCSRISGLLVGRSGPGHDELSARLLLIDLACSRHIGFERVFRRRFDRFVIGDSCWAIVRKRLLLKQSSHKNALGAWPLQAGCAGLAWPCSGS
jgi:hypothetical protein